MLGLCSGTVALARYALGDLNTCVPRGSYFPIFAMIQLLHPTPLIRTRGRNSGIERDTYAKFFTRRTMGDFYDLPVELRIRVLQHLPALDVVRFQQASTSSNAFYRALKGEKYD